jgi:hypothetical protein
MSVQLMKHLNLLVGTVIHMALVDTRIRKLQNKETRRIFGGFLYFRGLFNS